MRSVIIAASMAALLTSGAVAAETNTYSYDARGRLVQVVRTGGPSGNFTSTYALDDADNRTQVTIASGGTSGGSTGGTTPPSFSVANATSVIEGGPLLFTVTRNGGATTDFSVNIATTAGGTATSGSDFTAQSGTLTFTPSQSSRTFSVATINDSVVESAETVLVTLSGATGGATIGTAQASGTINDNDAPPPANSAPNAVNDSLTLTKCELRTFNLGINDTDADGDALSVTAVSRTSLGSEGFVTPVGGTFVDIEAPGTSGTTTWSYTLSDGRGGTDTATLSLTVAGGVCT